MFGMHDFEGECVKVFCALTGYDQAKLKPAYTPFIDENKDRLAILEKEDTYSVDTICTSGSVTTKTRASLVQARVPRGTFVYVQKEQS